MVYNNIQDLTVEADMSCVAADALTFCENSIYFTESMDHDYNMMMREFGKRELSVFESTGSEIVYEAVDIKGIKDAVVKFFKEQWAKVKGAFQSILNKFEQMAKESRQKFVDKVTQEMADNCGIDDFGTIHQIKDIDKIDMAAGAKTIFSQIQSEFDSLRNKADFNQDDVKNLKEKIAKEICSKVSSVKDVSTVKDMTKKLRETLLKNSEVKATKQYVSGNLKDIKEIVVGGTMRSVIKKQFNEAKKTFDNVISNVKKIDDKKIATVKEEVYLMKEVISAYNAAKNTMMDVAKKCYQENKNVLVKIISKSGKGGKGGKKTATGESYAPDVTNQRSVIESLFEW